jgi:hypothetical protein
MKLKPEDFEPATYRTLVGQYEEFEKYNYSETGGKEALYTTSQMQQVIDQCNAKDAENAQLKLQCSIELKSWQSQVVRAEQAEKQLAAAQAEIERLREALLDCDASYDLCSGRPDSLNEAPATTSTTDALREHDAKLVERIADEEFIASMRFALHEIADKIRKGEF